MEILNSVKEILLGAVMVVMAILMIMALIRAIIGPRFTDRVVAINMIGTETVIEICLLACALDQQYLADVALIYAMLSFLAIVVMVNIYLSVFRERSLRNREQMDIEAHEHQIEVVRQEPDENSQSRAGVQADGTRKSPVRDAPDAVDAGEQTEADTGKTTLQTAGGEDPAYGLSADAGISRTSGRTVRDDVLTEIGAEGEEES